MNQERLENFINVMKQFRKTLPEGYIFDKTLKGHLIKENGIMKVDVFGLYVTFSDMAKKKINSD